jgi:integrase
MPVYTDKRTGKKVIQYKVGYRYIPDPKKPGEFIKRPKFKTEVAGRSMRVARKLLARRELEWEQRLDTDENQAPNQQVHYRFSELVAWYLSLPKVRQKRSYRKDVQRSKCLLDYFGNKQADKIKPSMVESFQHQMLSSKSRYGKPYKPGTVNRKVALLKRIFNLAIREDMVVKNPCWKVAMLPENNQRERILSSDEYQTLLTELAPHIAPVVRVAYHTGMRLNEILGLTWDRVNMKKGYLNLEAENTKTAEPRRIYFDNNLWEVFGNAAKVRALKHDRVFTRNGKPIKSVRKGFDSACVRAGIKDFTFHDLRHTFNTNMRKAGVDQTVIMKLTGHKTLAMFNRYNTVDQDDARQAMDRLNTFLLEQNCAQNTDHLQTGSVFQKNRS